MESMKLNEIEQQRYAELFSACDIENFGAVSGNTAYELFLTAGLSQETLQQVAVLCGSKGLGRLDRTQFYVAVKLIAAAQCGFPVVIESLGAEVPLPKFHRSYDMNQQNYYQQQQQPVDQHLITDQDRNRAGISGLPQNNMFIAYAQTQNTNAISHQNITQHQNSLQHQSSLTHQNSLPTQPIQHQQSNVATMDTQQMLQQQQQQQHALQQQIEQQQIAQNQHQQQIAQQQQIQQQQQQHQLSQQHQQSGALPSQLPGGMGIPPPPKLQTRGLIGIMTNSSFDNQFSGVSEGTEPVSPQFSPRHTPPPLSPDVLSRSMDSHAFQAVKNTPQRPLQSSTTDPPPPQPPTATVQYTGTGYQTYDTQQQNSTAHSSSTHGPQPLQSTQVQPTQVQPTQVQPTPTQPSQPHKVEKGGWASFDDDDREGLITEEPKPWANFPDAAKALDTISISSEAESVDDVWSITDEQREYYIQQFQKMQTDLSNVISGNTAKQFFEKSKLAVAELSKIWHLSDMDRDGALSLEEFCTAMHLVVLRRNDIDLPEHLPPALMPYSLVTNKEEPFASDLPQGVKRLSPSSTPPASQWTATFPSNTTTQPTHTNTTTQPTHTNPTTISPTSSSVSSPGSRAAPVNFEFKPITADMNSQIVHPVALRMSPDGQPINTDLLDHGADPVLVSFDAVDDSAAVSDNDVTSPIQKEFSELELGADASGHISNALHGRPRPTPRKGQTVQSISMESSNPGLIRPPHLEKDADSGPPGPPPPLRGMKNEGDHQTTMHTDSKELPPAVPRRQSTKEMGRELGEQSVQTFAEVNDMPGNFADFSRFESIPSQEVLNVHDHVTPGLQAVISDKHKRSVSIDYKQFSTSSFGTMNQPHAIQSSDNYHFALPKPPNTTQNLAPPNDGAALHDTAEKGQPPKILLRQGSRDRRDLHAAVRKQKERNTMLSRLNSELNQELQEVMEQRIALEIQLEHLRPFSS